MLSGPAILAWRENENWDEIQEMFAQAAACIETLRQAKDTRNEKMYTAFYTQAESDWVKHDYLATHTKLGNIISKCAEAVPVAFLGLVLLPLLLRRARDGIA